MSPLSRRKILRPWLIVPLVAIVGAGAWLVLRPSDDSSAQAATTPVEQTVDVTSGTMAQTVSSSGTIQPTDTEDLTFGVAGTVTAVNVKAGQTVAKGAVLATIDSAELESAVASAQATVDTAEAKRADDEDADASDAQITADDATLASANSSLASAQDDLAGASLVSPIAGTVSAVDLTVGQQLGTGGTSGTGITGTGTGSGRSSSDLGSGGAGTGNAGTGTGSTSPSGTITVISTNSYTIPLNIDATEIANLKVGQKATVTPTTSAGTTGNGRFGGGFGGNFPGGFPGQPTAAGNGQGATGTGSAAGTTPTTAPVAAADAVTGTVTSVSAIATASSGVATFPVEVTVSGDTSGFHAGATAEVQIIYHQLNDVVQVRTQAITVSDTGSTVVVQANGKKETRTVTTGITANGMTQITSGLQAGESVVITLPNFGGRPGGTGGGQFPGAGAATATRGAGG